MRAELLETIIPDIPVATVRTIFSNDVRGTAMRLAFTPKLRPNAGTVVACSFASTPTLEATLHRAASALAEVAHTIWPRWYQPLLDPFVDSDSFEAHHLNQLKITAATARVPGVLPGWLKVAVAKRTHHHELLAAHLPLETNIAQLARAIAAGHLTFVLSLEDLRGNELHRRSFARAAEWLAFVTRSRIVAVVPASFATDPCFDAISYEALHLEDRAQDPPALPLTTIFPINGRPHPQSAAEQKLHAALERDATLATALAFNQRVDTTRGTSYIVDLLWREGALIVEIDGWETHGNRRAFVADRHRDYELGLSGFTVLRITNEEIERDIEIAVDKIRDVVRERQKQLESA